MDFSLPGLVGAAIGLVIGWVDFKLVAGLVEGKLRALRSPADRDADAQFERKVQRFRLAFFVGTVCFFPIVGYALGRSIGGQ